MYCIRPKKKRFLVLCLQDMATPIGQLFRATAPSSHCKLQVTVGVGEGGSIFSVLIQLVNDPKVGVLFLAHSSAKGGGGYWLQSQNSGTIAIPSLSRFEWCHFCFVKVILRVDPDVMVRWKPLRAWIKLGDQTAYQSISELSAITMVPFSTLYLNLIRSYRRNTLIIQKDPCDVICDVTQ